MRHRTPPSTLRRGVVAVLSAAALAAPTVPAHAAVPLAAATTGGNASYTAAQQRPALADRYDPGRRGPYRTRSGEYSLGALRLPGLDLPVDARALVVTPVGAPGRRPLALLLHGASSPCYRLDGDRGFLPEPDWPCPAGWAPLPSYRGFRTTQDLLASQGWVTVSVDLVPVDGQADTLLTGSGAQRAQVAQAHLAAWARWASSAAAWRSAPAAVRAGARPDLGRVLLVAHSEGAATANRVAVDAAVEHPGWTVRGMALLAADGGAHDPVPGVPVVSLVPSCDGSGLARAAVSATDDARDKAAGDGALRSSVLLVGANVLWFNEQWTPGTVSPAVFDDDWFATDDPTCGAGTTTRLTAAQQQRVAAAYVAAAARVTVLRDRHVLPLFDGSAARLRSVGRAVVLSHDLGGRRTALLAPADDGGAATASGGPVVRTCDIQVWEGTVGRRCGPQDPWPGTVPHYQGSVVVGHGGPVRHAFEARWTTAAGAVRLGLTGPRSLAAARDLELRVVVPPASTDTRFEVRLEDADGTVAPVGTATVRTLPAGAGETADGRSSLWWAQPVRLRLDRTALRAKGLDLDHVTALRLLPRSATGAVTVLDAWGRTPGLAPARTVPVVRVDVGDVTVAEGSGRRTAVLPLTVTGRLREPARVFVGAEGLDPSLHLTGLPTTVTVPVGATRVDVPLRITGDRRDDGPDDQDRRTTPFWVQGVRNAVGGDWAATLSVRDDDPTPPIRVTPLRSKVSEGGTLRWTLTVTGPTDLDLDVDVRFLRPTGGVELTSADVGAAWFTRHFGRRPPARPVALSKAGGALFVRIPAGTRSATISIPTRRDRVREGAERVRLRIPAPGEAFATSEGVPGLPHGATLTGRVRNV